MMMRYALVASDVPAIAAYLPGNYRILGTVDGQTVIAGRDRAGWTLEGYVIPRLGSGLYFATGSICRIPRPNSFPSNAAAAGVKDRDPQGSPQISPAARAAPGRLLFTGV